MTSTNQDVVHDIRFSYVSNSTSCAFFYFAAADGKGSGDVPPKNNLCLGQRAIWFTGELISFNL
jgi:hypothetical protein